MTNGYISSKTGHENGRVSEVIDLVDPNRSCDPLQDAPSARWASVGGNLNGRPLICGGWYPNNRLQDCFFVQGNTNQKISLTQERSSAGVVVLNGKKLHFNNQLIKHFDFSKKIVPDKNGDDFLWIVGGADGNGPRSADCCIGLKSTEFVYASGQTSSGPMLDFTIKDHCMVKLSDNRIFIIGGDQNGEISNQVWIADPSKDFEITIGQPLRRSRRHFSCAAFEDDIDGTTKIIIAGGNSPSQNGMDSVEILNLSVTGSQWTEGNLIII